MFSPVSKILLIGAGQLGSRYLQGLATYKIPIEIFIVDPSQKSLRIAQNRWEEVVAENSQHKVHYLQVLKGLIDEFDLCFTTTTADVRLSVVDQVLSKSRVRFWILEKVLAQSVEQVDLLEDLLTRAEGAWVNTARRSIYWHQLIQKHLPKGQAWSVSGNGGSWGMACNSIHFIDLVAWWTSEKLVSVDTSGLKRWFSSKRDGFWEVGGKLNLFFSGNTKLELSVDESNTPFSLILQNEQDSWRLEESVGSFTNSKGFSLPGKVELQRELTGPLVDQILKTGKCSLPSLSESAEMHRLLIDALLDHWNTSQHLKDFVLPIT